MMSGMDVLRMVFGMAWVAARQALRERRARRLRPVTCSACGALAVPDVRGSVPLHPVLRSRCRVG